MNITYQTLFEQKSKWRPDPLFWILFALLTFILAIVVFSCDRKPVWASDFSEYSNSQIVNAIFQAEGGYKAEYLYGIRSIKYKDEADARQICLNTVRNNRKRYEEYKNKKYSDFISFLGSKYCPIGADNDSTGLNQYWIKNVKFYLKKNKND